MSKEPLNCTDSELCTYLQALEAGYLPTCCSDTSQCAPSRSITIAAKSWTNGKRTGAYHGFRFSMTCESSTGANGEDLSTSSPAGSRAKTSAPPAKAQESTASGLDCGEKWPASLAKYDPHTRSWKTRQCLLGGGLAEYAETWPRWGMTRRGELYRRPTPSGLLAIRAWITSGSGCGLQQRVPTPTVQDKCRDFHNQRDGSKRESLLGFVRRVPTPTATDGRKWNAKTKEQRKAHGSSVRLCNEDRGDGQPIGGQLNPTWVEWLIGWPIGWTDLEPLATDSVRLQRPSPGKYFSEWTNMMYDALETVTRSVANASGQEQGEV